MNALSPERIKLMDQPSYWHDFGRCALQPKDRPTPQEAAEYVSLLHSRITDAERRAVAAHGQERLANQHMQEFSADVQKLVRKFQTWNPEVLRAANASAEDKA